MTKSPNTKNEQQKDLCITSEQLTEQWKKGELPAGRYWVKYRSGRIDDWDLLGGKTIETKPEIVEVLAPVPRYDEWQASENYIDYLKQCISVYERKDKQATETSIAYNELLEENTKLKELLKQCRSALVRFVSYDDSDENARILLMNKINELLK